MSGVFDYIVVYGRLSNGTIVCADCCQQLVRVSGVYSAPAERREFEAEGCSLCGRSEILKERSFLSATLSAEHGAFEGAMRREAESVRNVSDALTAAEMDEVDFREYVKGLLKDSTD